jgi:hypothetical protein
MGTHLFLASSTAPSRMPGFFRQQRDRNLQRMASSTPPVPLQIDLAHLALRPILDRMLRTYQAGPLKCRPLRLPRIEYETDLRVGNILARAHLITAQADSLPRALPPATTWICT